MSKKSSNRKDKDSGKASGEPAKQVNITISEEDADRFSEIVKKCRDAGLQVDQELEAIGVVTGSIKPEDLKKLRGVKGVSAVEGSADYQIPPPESDLQ